MAQPNENSSQNKLDFAAEETKELTEKYVRKPPTSELVRLAFLTLLDASMRFRNMFFQADIESIRNSPEPTAQQALGSMMPGQAAGFKKLSTKKARQIHNNSLAIMEKKILHFNKIVQQEIDSSRAGMPEKTRDNFDSIGNFLANCTEELLMAADQHEILMLLTMYNRGDLDLLFTEYRADKQKSNEATVPSTE